jgi:DNA primase
VIFPIRDSQRRPIGFGARVLPGNDDPRKYVNSRDTRLFSKSEQVYGLDLARDEITRKRQVAVVEGYTDVIMAHQHGLKNFVAVLGTALGPGHIRLLRRYADSIVLVLDGDEAGQRRANEVIELFVASDVDLRILTLPEKLDPCDFVAAQGADAMRERLETAPDAFEHAIRVQTRGVDLIRDTHQANQALERMLSILAKVPTLSTEATSAKILRERQVLARLAREFHVDESLLRTRMGDMRKKEAESPRRAESEPLTPRVLAGDLEPVEAELLEILARHPALAETALLELTNEQLKAEPVRIIFAMYRRLGEEGHELEFGRVLSELEEPSLKHLLVELDERAQSKEEFASEDAAVRLRQLIDRIRYRDEASERDACLAQLEQNRLDEEEEAKVLQQLFEKKLAEQKMKRQGSPAPTDG